MKIDDRMKRYEFVSKSYLMRRTPVLIRIDGKAFHTFTKHCDKPYDEDLHEAFNSTMKTLLCEIQGAVLAYGQSDEISILLRDWDTLTTDAWFDYNVQKIVSVSASIATIAFNCYYFNFSIPSVLTYKFALFDSRAFNIPIEEVINYFIWRQQDATRNSINSLAQQHFSNNELLNKKCNDTLDMLMNRGVDWNKLHTWKKRGTCVYKNTKTGIIDIDENIPIFTADRNYINKFLSVEEKLC